MKEIQFTNNTTNYPMSDIGTSKLFIDTYKDELLYCAENDYWYYFNGKHWQIDTMLKRNELIKDLAEFCTNQIFQTVHNQDQGNLLKWYGKLGDKNYRDKILKDAMSINPVCTSNFNSHKFLFNCTNGTYDFEKGLFREHNRNDMLTDISGVEYDPNATCPRFNKFMDEIMISDKTKIDYLLEIAAYALTGDTSKECFFVLYGDSTRNGKGTYVATLSRLMGSYAQTLNPAAITRKQINNGASAASPEMAKLTSSRLVNVNELEDGMLLDVALMKSLTGGDSMTARNLYKNEFEYTPQFKILINTNVLPRMTDDSIFRSDRMHIVAFNRHFEEHERDTNLKVTLQQELSGIFNLLIAQYKIFKSKGFTIPAESKQILESYHTDSNHVIEFANEKLTKDPRGAIKASYAYNLYKEWSQDNGYPSTGKKVFKERMIRLGAIFTDKVSKKLEGMASENTYWIEGYSI